MEPEHDQAIIAFYNNSKRNGSITPTRHQKSSVSDLLVNTKFHIDKKMTAVVSAQPKTPVFILGQLIQSQSQFEK